MAIESQAEGAATFQLPGAVVVALARAARRGLETTSQLPVERATEGGLHSAQQLVAFLRRRSVSRCGQRWSGNKNGPAGLGRGLNRWTRIPSRKDSAMTVAMTITWVAEKRTGVKQAHQAHHELPWMEVSYSVQFLLYDLCAMLRALLSVQFIPALGTRSENVSTWMQEMWAATARPQRACGGEK